MAFTSLNHYLDAEWLRYAYECTRKHGAVGVDGQTGQEYAAALEPNLQSLLEEFALVIPDDPAAPPAAARRA